jgi:hypothetical protein
MPALTRDLAAGEKPNSLANLTMSLAAEAEARSSGLMRA